MPIVVEVKSKEDYAKWVAGQKQKVQAAADDPSKVWDGKELAARGEKVFAANCAACHQANGKGVPNAFPALDGSKVVLGPKNAQIDTVLNGVVKGGKPTAMAAFGKQLNNVELAAVITTPTEELPWKLDGTGVAAADADDATAGRTGTGLRRGRAGDRPREDSGEHGDDDPHAGDHARRP